MPNIANVEFFGLRKELAVIKICKLTKQLAEHRILKDMVFTIHKEVDVINKDLKKSRPFIRLTGTPGGDLVDVIEILKTLNLGIEVMVLDKFIPAKSE